MVSSKKIVKPYSGTITCAQARKNQAAVVQPMDSAMHWINLYPLDNAVGLSFLVRSRNLLLPNYTYSLNRDLSGG